jgi:hypothetical protein
MESGAALERKFSKGFGSQWSRIIREPLNIDWAGSVQTKQGKFQEIVPKYSGNIGNREHYVQFTDFHSVIHGAKLDDG